MIQIRNHLFETNSSSVHALVIPKDQKISIPDSVTLRYGSYGWEGDTCYDTLDYVYTACRDRNDVEVAKLISYLKLKGVTHIEVMNNTGEDGIDHSYEVPLEDLFANDNLLDRFIFGNASYVRTGNDNDDDMDPSMDDYGDADVIIKTN